MAKSPIHLTLRQRIYFSMLTLILLSFVVTGITAYYNFRTQEEEYNISRLSRKEMAVQESMRYFLATNDGYMATDSVPILFSDKVCELADVHGLAINFYSLRGELLISSSTTDFDELGFTQQIDYQVMKQLSMGNSRAEMAKDIDHGKYIMAYWYFRDIEGKPIAITNVRYDKKEVDEEELKSFLGQLTQIYVLLFLGASLFAFILSNYITSSLQKIGKRMQNLELGKTNEPLEWDSDDEIGALVKEYNRMMKEVEASASVLAKSERESAWREMAKQVAHEIKNPLTPMKLRVQHLTRSYSGGEEQYQQKLDAFRDSMIEQIDALSNIASEFSNFAKMPKAQNEEVNLHEVISSCLDLFDKTDGIELSYVNQIEDDAVVYADKDQMVRVFNNLVKNAIQAIPASQEGKIHIRLMPKDEDLLIEVCDNGSGIPEDMRSKIFQPNFTTKSTGTGLGLAMVQNIIHQAGGSITFATSENRGTCFKVMLPTYTA